MKILLLEDNQTLNETIKLRLELKGYKVHSYSCGQDAYDNITNGYSCFLLDIHVPNVDGIKILKKIRDFYADCPVIIISSTVELDIIKESYSFGCNDYLKKPFFIDELEIKIDKLCNIPTNEIILGRSCIFNFKESVLTVDNKRNDLTEKESLLVNLFAINLNKLVTYENIQNYVWKGEYASIDAIRTLIRRLRKKMPLTIKASSNRGYYLLLTEN
ncbi:response regulator transcription factor [Arcobacter roscoffensis]|uniref:Response regulator transcription factor n=1 Tax=Arcobacter roscoffensis TaxID=2961520 RepID=A0ABY5E4X7_9BACT|nr:response regulator transcription factor [Arcobacter roscoffensis]UTJ06579.1 response regulator transcription factor [Arcobacter roscoffensis]